MSLERTDSVDAMATENNTGYAILTIADSWRWDDERRHLLALQAKLNAYFSFIESGQMWESYPAARGRQLVIDVITRFPPTTAGMELLRKAAALASQLSVEVRHRNFPGAVDDKRVQE